MTIQPALSHMEGGMQVLEWLRRMVPGFEQLSVAERTAIRDFALLWSLFEGTALDNSASAERIVNAAAALRDRGRLDLRPFQRSIEHFRRRYHDGQNFTPTFERLRWRRNDNRPLVENFVAGAEIGEAETLAGLLIIVYRLRNNLFHGFKWDYVILGQQENFRHANNCLMAVMELYEGRQA